MPAPPPPTPFVWHRDPLVEGQHVRVGPSGVGDGLGVFTLCELPARAGGLRLGEYQGVRIEGREAELNLGEVRYVMEVRADRGAGGVWVDGAASGHWTSRVQHGRAGPGLIFIYHYGGGVWFRTLGRAIPAGQELVYNYGSRYWHGKYRERLRGGVGIGIIFSLVCVHVLVCARV